VRNLWTKALWGGIVGIVLKDMILLIGRSAGWVRLNLLASIADVFTARTVAFSPSGMILGFVIHLLWGAAWALLFTAAIRVLHSRHNLIAGIINGLLVWLLWGLVLPPAGMGPQPWVLGTPTTLVTLLASLAYGLSVGYAVSEEAVQV